MRHTGSIESLMWDERGGKLRLSGTTSDISIYEVQKPSLPKDLKTGDLIAVETVQRGQFEVLLSLQRQEAVAPQQTAEEIAQIIRNAPSQPIPPDVVTLIREADSKTQVESPPTSITISEPKLPDSIPELQQFILVSHEALKIYRTKLDAVNRLNVAQAVRNQTLEDGQKVGTALLWAEAKLGELLEGLADPTASRAGRRQLPEGITHKQSHFAQQLAEHKDLIEEVIQEAKENEDIPTRTQLLQKVKAQEAPPKPEPLPREKEIDQNIIIPCKTCDLNFRLIHVRDGKHRLEDVMVVEKA